jgi:hypothetical protein
MKNYVFNFLKCITLVFTMVILVNVAIAQTPTTLYSTNFDNSGNWPTGWSAVGGSTTYSVNTTSPSNNYSGASGNYNADNGTNGSATLVFNNSLSTVGYSSITAIWGARMTSSGASPTFQWSSDGSNWNTISFTDVANNST